MDPREVEDHSHQGLHNHIHILVVLVGDNFQRDGHQEGQDDVGNHEVLVRKELLGPVEDHNQGIPVEVQVDENNQDVAQVQVQGMALELLQAQVVEGHNLLLVVLQDIQVQNMDSNLAEMQVGNLGRVQEVQDEENARVDCVEMGFQRVLSEEKQLLWV